MTLHRIAFSRDIMEWYSRHSHRNFYMVICRSIGSNLSAFGGESSGALGIIGGT